MIQGRTSIPLLKRGSQNPIQTRGAQRHKGLAPHVRSQDLIRPSLDEATICMDVAMATAQ